MAGLNKHLTTATVTVIASLGALSMTAPAHAAAAPAAASAGTGSKPADAQEDILRQVSDLMDEASNALDTLKK